MIRHFDGNKKTLTWLIKMSTKCFISHFVNILKHCESFESSRQCRGFEWIFLIITPAIPVLSNVQGKHPEETGMEP